LGELWRGVGGFGADTPTLSRLALCAGHRYMSADFPISGVIHVGVGGADQSLE